MAKNRLTDLNDHLFTQLERLNDEELKGENLAAEIERTRAITAVSKEIVANGRLVMEASKLAADNWGRDMTMPKMLTGSQEQ